MRIVFLCLVTVSILVAACGGSEPTSPPATATATVTPTATAVPPQPSSTPPPATVGHLVSGLVLDSSTSLLLGGEVRLEPLGMAATTDISDGSFQIIGVPDGTYQVTVLPQCVAYGCYSAQVLVVSGSDETEFNLAPVPAVVLPSGPPAVRSLAGTGVVTIPLDRVEFPQDHLLLISPNDMEAGESAQLIVAAPECFRCGPLLAVNTLVAWSLEPEVGANIDPESGLLSIDADSPVGSTYSVTAEVGGGQYSVTTEVTVYSAADNPLAGVWREPEIGDIKQLLFTSDGRFAVTINPYEHYQDYWGTYIFDLATGSIELTATGANQVAPEGEGTGTFAIDPNGALVLEGVCLGGWDPNTQSLTRNCGHELVR